MKTSQWSKRQRTDCYVQQAKRHGYRSRSAYKLKQIAHSTGLFTNAKVVVDCGASPGGWLQVAKEMVPRAVIVGVDILPINSVPGVMLVQGDICNLDTWQQIQYLLCGKSVDVMICDLSVNLSGVKVIDDSKNAYLYQVVLSHAISVLAPRGRLLCKVFHGEAGDTVAQMMGTHFHTYKAYKPRASRTNSSEYYLLARDIVKQ